MRKFDTKKFQDEMTRHNIALDVKNHFEALTDKVGEVETEFNMMKENLNMAAEKHLDTLRRQKKQIDYHRRVERRRKNLQK